MLAIAAIAAFSCSKEKLEEKTIEANLTQIIIQASSEGGLKAAFSAEGYPSIVWTGTESISVLGTNTGNQTFTTTSTGTSAEFSGLADLTDENLYAVYPADNAITLDEGEAVTLSNVTIPSQQQAVAGSFDPDALVAVASTTSAEKNFTFKSLVSFFKFQLEDVTSVEKVIFVGNNDENMAGKVSALSPGDLDSGTYADVSKSITVTGPFESGKYYFAATLPQLFEKGVTIYVKYSDGSVKSCKINSQLFEAGKTRNCIRNLKTIPSAKLKTVTDLYALYSIGVDVTVGSSTFNINQENAPTPSVISATGADVSLHPTINGAEKNIIVFLEQEEGYKFTLPSVANLTERVILVSRYPDKQVTLNADERILAQTGSIYFKNIEITCPTSKTYFIYNYKQTTVVEAIVFDGCKITGIDTNLLELSGSGIINNIEIVNSDLKFKSTTTTVSMLIRSNQSVVYPKVVLNENVFFCENDNARQMALFSNSNTIISAGIGSLTFTKNTIAGLYPTDTYSYFMVKTLAEYTEGGNYFHLPKYSDSSYAGTDKYLSIVNATTNPEESKFTLRNRSYLWYDSSAGTAKTLKAFKTNLTTNDAGFHPYMKNADADSLLTIDWSAETFVCSKSNWGATR